MKALNKRNKFEEEIFSSQTGKVIKYSFIGITNKLYSLKSKWLKNLSSK
jgi:hypothetical protein